LNIDGDMEEVLIMGVSKTTGRIVAPKNVSEAYDRDDLEMWIACWDDEMKKLSKMEHITHGHTRKELEDLGITAPPISTRMISDAKYKGHEFDKRKGRLIVQGFKQITLRWEGVHTSTIAVHTKDTYGPSGRERLESKKLGYRTGIHTRRESKTYCLVVSCWF